jgi:magnesium transporter
MESPEQIREFLGAWPVVWVNVDGLGDAAVIERIGQVFGLHPLALEDVVHVHQRPKLDEYAGHLYLVLRNLEPAMPGMTEQLSLFLGNDFVLTFQERPGDAFNPVRERIRQSRGVIRTCGPDYLAYALVDAVVDAYFPILEKFGDRAEALEREVVAGPTPAVMSRIYALKRDLATIRRALWHQREAVRALLDEGLAFITRPTRLGLRDCYDHAIQVLELVETDREQASELVDAYVSSLGYKLNRIMTVLTVIATIFIPLTFLAGVWGMNFEKMPELRWEWGYPAALGVMALAGSGMYWYFRRQGLLSVPREDSEKRRKE